ncbi:hypothetical protein ACOMHN_032986 [Nucella lapillus]
MSCHSVAAPSPGGGPGAPGPMQYLVVERAGDTDDDLSDWEAPVDVDLGDPPLPRNRKEGPFVLVNQIPIGTAVSLTNAFRQ